MISISIITKGHNFIRQVHEVTGLVLCRPTDEALHCTKYHEIILNHFKVIQQTGFPYQILQSGIILQKKVHGAVCLVLSTLSDDAVYLYQVS